MKFTDLDASLIAVMEAALMLVAVAANIVQLMIVAVSLLQLRMRTWIKAQQCARGENLMTLKWTMFG